MVETLRSGGMANDLRAIKSPGRRILLTRLQHLRGTTELKTIAVGT
jgi:hypothetical protein